MKTIAVEVHDGVLQLPKETRLPAHTRLAVLAIEDNGDEADLATLADAGGAFDFLREEPELYSDADIQPSRRNPRFGKRD